MQSYLCKYTATHGAKFNRAPPRCCGQPNNKRKGERKERGEGGEGTRAFARLLVRHAE
jgi:hypothetical protein